MGVWRGLFIRGGDVLEKVLFIDIIVFDKMGMFIVGWFVVKNVICNSSMWFEKELLVFVVGVERVIFYFIVKVLV